MKYLETEIKENVGYVIPIGDIHLGDTAFKKEGHRKLIGYLDWVKEHPNSRVFLNGDIFNVASRISKTSPFDTETEEYQMAIDIFKPYASQIIGATDGNHEARMKDMFGVTPLQWFCRELKIPYCGWSAVVRFKVGKKPEDTYGNRYHQNYFGYFHHTTGGGSTIGGKINRVVKLRDIVEGMDMYFGSHNHQLVNAPQDVFYASMQGGIKKRRIWYIDCGSFLEWDDSYAEKGMMSPTKLGSPKVTLSGEDDDHDVHISI